MVLKLHGHIGSNVSALVDGQLSPAEEEKAWRHVLGCPGCRRLVEREGWIKRRLAGLAGPAEVAAPAGLLGNLYDVDAWAAVDRIERRATRRRAAAMLVGAGSVGAAVVAMMVATTPPVGRGELPARVGRTGPAVIAPGGVVPAASRGDGADVGVGLTAEVSDPILGGARR